MSFIELCEKDAEKIALMLYRSMSYSIFECHSFQCEHRKRFMGEDADDVDTHEWVKKHDDLERFCHESCDKYQPYRNMIELLRKR